MEVENCSLCDEAIEPQRTPDGEIFWSKGHNAQPLSDGRACDGCNTTKVIPSRIANLRSTAFG